jgi:predicted nucleic acid-binding protein
VKLLALVDTNVVVSGVLAGVDTSPTRGILDAMLAGTVRFVLSEALLTEYRDVLLRPSIRDRHQLTESDVDAILEELVLNACLQEPPAGEPPSPVVRGDEHVLALLTASPQAVLVTGDLRLREAVASWREALTPAEFAASLS